MFCKDGCGHAHKYHRYVTLSLSPMHSYLSKGNKVVAVFHLRGMFNSPSNWTTAKTRFHCQMGARKSSACPGATKQWQSSLMCFARRAKVHTTGPTCTNEMGFCWCCCAQPLQSSPDWTCCMAGVFLFVFVCSVKSDVMCCAVPQFSFHLCHFSYSRSSQKRESVQFVTAYRPKDAISAIAANVLCLCCQQISLHLRFK